MRRRSIVSAAWALVAGAAVLAGCGGGGGGAAPAPPVAASPGTIVQGSLKIAIPTNAQTRERQPRFVSASVQSIAIAVSGVSAPTVVNVGGSSTACTTSGSTRTCAIALGAPAGSDTFTVTLYDAANGTGNVLGSGSTTQTVVANQAFNVTVTVAGTPAKVRVGVGQSAFTTGSTATTTVTVALIDAGNVQITGSYANPVTLTNSDTTGTFTLSPTTITSSSQTAILTYNGTGSATSTTIGASVSGVVASNVTAAQITVGTPAVSGTLIPAPAIGTNPPEPFALATGPDGNVWYTDFNQAAIGRVAVPSGAVTAYAIPGGGLAVGITSTGGNLFFSALSKIGSISPAGTFGGTTATTSSAVLMTTGPDGNLWYLSDSTPSQVGRVSTSLGTPTLFNVPTANSLGLFSRITTGPDGALWFTESTANKIGRVTTSGSFTEFAVPLPSPTPGSLGNPWGLTSGPDGALWFTEYAANKIGRITTSGGITEYAISGSYSLPSAITTGPDGNLWFTVVGGVGKITTAGVMTLYPQLNPATNGTIYGTDIVAGSDGMLYTNTLSPGGIVRFPPH